MEVAFCAGLQSLDPRFLYWRVAAGKHFDEQMALGAEVIVCRGDVHPCGHGDLA
jgi:hypothetical protein